LPPLKDLLAVAISAIALAVSLWSARRGWRFNLASLRKITRNNQMTAIKVLPNERESSQGLLIQTSWAYIRFWRALRRHAQWSKTMPA